MDFTLNNFRVQTIGKDIAVSFEIENDDLSVQYSEVLTLTRDEDSKLYNALDEFILAKLKKENG